MSTNEQAVHVSLSIPSEHPPTTDNLNFMSDTFTLSQDGASSSTQIPLSQGYAGTFSDLLYYSIKALFRFFSR